MAEPDLDAIVPALAFDSGPLPPGEGFKAQQRIQVHFDIERLDGGDFLTRASAWRIGQLLVTHSTTSPRLFTRTEQKAFDGGDQLLLAMATTTPWQLWTSRGRLDVAEGQPCLIDLARPCQIRSEDLSTTIIIQFPRALLAAYAGKADLHGLVFEGASGRMLARFLVALVEHLPMMRLREAPAVADGTLELIMATLRSQGIAEAEALPGGLLPRAMTMLLRHGAEQSIAQIAFAVGFSSAAHFSRRFRETYGCAPRDAFKSSLHTSLPDERESDVIGEYLRIKQLLWS
jgi:AraC-like DNA-binding protein